jgi:hypothetical protein
MEHAPTGREGMKYFKGGGMGVMEYGLCLERGGISERCGPCSAWEGVSRYTKLDVPCTLAWLVHKRGRSVAGTWLPGLLTRGLLTSISFSARWSSVTVGPMLLPEWVN